MLEIVISLIYLITMTIALLAGTPFMRYVLRSNTQINRLLFFALVCFFVGFMYDSIRLWAFALLGSIDPTVDKLFFCFKVFLIFVAISALLRLMFIMNRQGGRPVKRESIIRLFYYGMICFLTIFNIYFYEEIPLDSGTLYIFQIHPITLLILLVAYVPALIFVIFKTFELSRKINQKTLSKLTLIFGILIILIAFERLANVNFYSSVFSSLFHSSLYGLLADSLFILILLSLVSFNLFFGRIDLLETISSFFCLKTLYLIKKETGHIFYEHEFRATGESTSALLTDRFLLGGFLYAITQGLELGLGLSGDIDIIQAGKTTILLRHGKFVFGLLFTLEHTPTLEGMVRKFMERFEQAYGSVLENWSGDLSRIKMEQLHAWTLEIFKRF